MLTHHNKINNRISELFKRKKSILSIYFTAGFPTINDTTQILSLLQTNGADLIEIGIPFSDSLMDGPFIQDANNIAIKNGMTLNILFEQLKEVRKEIHVPLILMGSMNVVYQYGFEKFCKRCTEVGIDGTILPEMPLKEYNNIYKEIYERNNLSNIFMITPQTSIERIHLIDESSNGFLYLVSSNSTTGNSKDISLNEIYFKKIRSLNLRNPTMIGFNINKKADFDIATQYSSGAIIGTAFIKLISKTLDENNISSFMKEFK